LINDISDSVIFRIGASNTFSFQGVFNGNNKTITLAIDMFSSENVGLFGYCSNATIQNLIVDGYVIGYRYVGGIVGWCLGGSSVTNCINNASIEGNNYAGGIVGLSIMGGTTVVVTNCINNGNIEGIWRIGGIVGCSYSTISSCINTGNITAIAQYAGGISSHSHNGSRIEYCLNIGTVRGGNNVGGILAASNEDNNGIATLVGNINSGFIFGGSEVGGITGYNDETLFISNCINTGVVIGSSNVGSILGRNTGTLTINNCHYDKQMSIYGGVNDADVIGGTTGHLTRDMVGEKLLSLLRNTD
jgi:hypothetical protein